MKQSPFLVPESQLLPRLARRDEQAFSWLYDQYAHVLYGVVLTIVGKPNLAAQVVEEVFVQAWADFDSYSPRQSSLLTWLLTRARKTAHGVFTPQITSSMAKNSQDSTDVDNLLTAEHRTLLYSMYFRGQSAEEAARVVQVPIQGLRKLVQATLQELKHIFSR